MPIREICHTVPKTMRKRPLQAEINEAQDTKSKESIQCSELTINKIHVAGSEHL